MEHTPIQKVAVMQIKAVCQLPTNIKTELVWEQEANKFYAFIENYRKTNTCVSVWVCILTCDLAAPSAEWSWTSGGSEGPEERWDAARLWFCSRDPHKRSVRGCRYEPPSLVNMHTHTRTEVRTHQAETDSKKIVNLFFKLSIKACKNSIPFVYNYINACYGPFITHLYAAHKC